MILFSHYNCCLQCAVPLHCQPLLLDLFDPIHLATHSELPFRFAFVEYEDSRDSEDAFNSMHDRVYDGQVLNVQVCIFALETN